MDQPTHYQIRVKGHLDTAWTEWFEGLTLTNEGSGDALLSGLLPDQAALQGILKRISSLGLTLISVNPIADENQMDEEVPMNTNPTFLERHSLAVFLILTALISFAIPLFIPLPPEITPLIIAIFPALLAILLTALTDGGKGVRALLKKLTAWQIDFKWYVIGLGLALGLRMAISLLALLLGWIPAIQLRAWPLPQFILLGTFILVGGALEELGWRGFALPKLLTRHSALFSALFLGLIWGILHISLTFPGQMNAGSHWLPTVLQITGLSVVLTWLYIQTGGSIVIPMLFHVGQNLFVVLNEGITLTQQLWLLTVVTLAYSLVIYFLFRANLQRDPVNKPSIVLEEG